MPIEVRQLLITSSASGDPPPRPTSGDAAPSAEWRERLREELMAECKAWVEDRLQRARER